MKRSIGQRSKKAKTAVELLADQESANKDAPKKEKATTAKTAVKVDAKKKETAVEDGDK